MQVQRNIEIIRSSRLIVDVPESFVNRQAEVIVIILDEPEVPSLRKRRVPPPQFAGKVREIGDVMTSIPLSDWGVDE